MSLQDITDELYCLPLQEFTSTRNARVKDLRRSDRGVADAVAALPKPTAAAWALNVFSRRHPDELAPLLDLGRRLREAQEQLAGDVLRELSAQAGEAVPAVVDRVRATARDLRTELSDAAAREVEHTLRAAMADEGAELAVRVGVLVRPLQAPGFGRLDVADAVAVPVGDVDGAARRGNAARKGTKPARKAETARAGADLQRARQAAQAALEELEHADDEVARHEERLEGAATAHERARQRVQQLRDELAVAEQDEARTAAGQREARDERDAALKHARSARGRAEAAQRRLDAAV